MSLLLALTGGSAGAYTLTADAGGYSLSGQSSNVLRSKRLVAVSSAYALTGVAAGILHSYKLTAVSGAYTLTGVAAIISYTPIAGAYVLTANAGAYTLNGSAAAVLHSHRLTSATGAYALSGLPANVYRNKKLASNAGSYSYSGNAANIVYTPIASGYTLTANSGSYVLSGKDAGLSYATPTGFNGGFVMRKRKVYVKRGKQYLIFNNNEEADSYLAAEQAIETAKKSSRGAAKRVIKALKVVKPEIAPEPKLEELSALIAKFDFKYDLPQLAKNNDIEVLYHIQSMLYALQQDEEDIELLLLAL
jgi:hypothetical protein